MPQPGDLGAGVEVVSLYAPASGAGGLPAGDRREQRDFVAVAECGGPCSDFLMTATRTARRSPVRRVHGPPLSLKRSINAATVLAAGTLELLAPAPERIAQAGEIRTFNCMDGPIGTCLGCHGAATRRSKRIVSHRNLFAASLRLESLRPDAFALALRYGRAHSNRTPSPY